MAPFSTAILLAALATAASSGEIDPAKASASLKTIAKTKIPAYELIDQARQGMQWTPENIADLGEALTAASRAVAELHRRFPSAVADTYQNRCRINVGAITNMEDTAKYFSGNGDLSRGCISHQSATFDAVRPVLANSTLVVRKVRIGTVFQHNAVVVFPRGMEEKYYQRSGVILDAWLSQNAGLDCMVYTFKNWISIGDRPRLLKDDE